MEKYRQQVEEMQDQLQETELTFSQKITVQERNALANWMKARDWERRLVQQSRENAYLKYRLCMMEGEMLPVGSMRCEQMLGKPELQKPVWQAPRLVPRMNSSTSPQGDPEMPTVGRGVRVFPHCLGPLRFTLPHGVECTRLPSSSSISTVVDMGASATPRSSTTWPSVPNRSLWNSRGQ
ncbi:transport and Golgi organization protein 1 homolog [Meles meles]|uniref:transport and Golgi organization protein 1 homolog n=1 Tax=Meles meles TaxID=9662 RepID=UPI001E69C114|nr:transport and Golgi organization protein 1 homolog [Meles meles]